MPVPITPENGKRDAVPPKFRSHGLEQFPHLAIDRADTAEMVIMMCYVEKPLSGHVPSPGHVLEEGKHILGFFRTAETHDQNRVEGLFLRFGRRCAASIAVFRSCHACVSPRDPDWSCPLFCRQAVRNLKSILRPRFLE